MCAFVDWTTNIITKMPNAAFDEVNVFVYTVVYKGHPCHERIAGVFVSRYVRRTLWDVVRVDRYRLFC